MYYLKFILILYITKTLKILKELLRGIPNIPVAMAVPIFSPI